ncbi:MAG: UDP-N-acetyl glucosamine 2-epimerase [Nitrospirales bacterium]|nr:MAG: UDP-N-acetyl glucosamine 2-epimerase [Nitrospirales bacterium]
MRTIAVVTGSRAEYGLLRPLIRLLDQDRDVQLQLIATGMHLSPEFGLTYRQIEQDGFSIARKVEALLSSDTSAGVAKSMGVALIGFADVFTELAPDLVVVLGDRFEIFAAASAAMIAKIPITHLHGGESTEGLIDEPIRHSITKMSHLHFTATEDYRNRIIQLGEQPERVFNFGALGIDSIRQLKLLPKKIFEETLDFKLGKRNLLITFHPVTFEEATAERQFGNLLHALDELEDTHLLFTKGNADTDGRIINQMIDRYVASHSYKAWAYTSLGQLRYLSALQYMDGVIGNSSSGLIEAPSFKIGTINIGERQRGRIKAESVIDCESSEKAIRAALNELFSVSFQHRVKTVSNPYGEGGTTEKILGVIKTYPLEGILKKRFYDFDFA